MKNITLEKHPLARAITLATLAFAANQAQAVNYTFSDMGTLAYADTTPMLSGGLNDLGQVAGGALYHGDWSRGTPRMYNGSSWVALDTLANPVDSYAYDINNAGQLTGYANVDSTGESFSPIRWNGTTANVLNRIPNDWFTAGTAINNNGQIAGIAETNDGYYHPIRWDGAVATQMQTLGGLRTFVMNMNDYGEVVGDAYTADGSFDLAVYWDANGNITQLNKLHSSDSDGLAYSINNLGHIVGTTWNAEYSGTYAAYWDSSTANPIELTAPGFTNLQATDINNLDQIVGWGTDANSVYHALLWDQGTVTDLNQYFSASLIADGWKFNTNQPFINNQGMIVGHMFSSDSTQLASWSLTPTSVPVPGAVWLFGSALAGFITMKRRKQTLAA